MLRGGAGGRTRGRRKRGREAAGAAGLRDAVAVPGALPLAQPAHVRGAQRPGPAGRRPRRPARPRRGRRAACGRAAGPGRRLLPAVRRPLRLGEPGRGRRPLRAAAAVVAPLRAGGFVRRAFRCAGFLERSEASRRPEGRLTLRRSRAAHEGGLCPDLRPDRCLPSLPERGGRTVADRLVSVQVLVNTACCVLMLVAKLIQRVVFGPLRVSERQVRRRGPLRLAVLCALPSAQRKPAIKQMSALLLCVPCAELPGSTVWKTIPGKPFTFNRCICNYRLPVCFWRELFIV